MYIVRLCFDFRVLLLKSERPSSLIWVYVSTFVTESVERQWTISNTFAYMISIVYNLTNLA